MDLHPLDGLSHRFAAAHPEEAALALAELPPAEAAAFFDRCPPSLAAAVVQAATPQEWVGWARCLPPDRTASVLQEMPRESVATMLRRLSREERSALLVHLPAAMARAVERLLRHEQGTAGALMEPVVLSVRVELRAGQALEAIQREPRHLRYYVYAVGQGERLVGVTDLRRLMVADPATPLREIVTTDVHRIPAQAGPEVILEHPGWDHVHALPVVDERNVLLGVLDYRTVRRLARRRRRRKGAATPVAALAELYWSGSRRTAGELVSIATGRPS